MVFIGLIGLGIWWLQKLKAEIKEKRYFNLVLTIVVAILTLYNSFFRQIKVVRIKTKLIKQYFFQKFYICCWEYHVC